MNQKFFDPEDDGKIQGATIKSGLAAINAEEAPLSEKLLKQAFEQEQEEKACIDGGEGFPPAEDEAESSVDKRAAFA